MNSLLEKRDTVEDETTVTEQQVQLTCRVLVQSLVKAHGWAILTEDDLVRLVLASGRVADAPDALKRLIKNYYISALYAACQQADDVARREQGYTELFRYLYRAAYNRWPDLAEDISQQALLLVFEQIDRCREPVAFLAFALNKLWQAMQQIRPSSASLQPYDDLVDVTADSEAFALDAQLVTQEGQQHLADALNGLPNHQRNAIISKFVYGMSDSEASMLVGLTIGHLRVLRHRALERLHRDDALREYFENVE